MMLANKFYLYMMLGLLGATIGLNGIAQAECLDDKNQSTPLASVSVTLKGGNVAENASLLYRYLSERNVLPCRWVTVSSKNVPLSTLLRENRISPIGFPASMETLICSFPLNKNKCGNGVLYRYVPGDRILVPNVRFKSFSSITKVAQAPPGESFEDALQRTGFYERYKNEEERKQIIENVQKRNLGFQRPIYDHNGKESYLLPVDAYQTTIGVPPEDLKSHPTLLRLLQEGNVSFELISDPERIQVKSSTLNTLGQKFSQVLKIINNVPVAGIDHAKVLIADRGFDKANVYLEQEMVMTSPAVKLYGEDGTCDKTKNHGTHIWGIIAGNVPGVFEGIARGSLIVPWNFDKNSDRNTIKDDIEKYYNFSLVSFLQSTQPRTFKSKALKPSDLNVVNLSVGLEKYFASETSITFDKLVMETPSFLYVVAAGNENQQFSANEKLDAPVSAYDSSNVVVVTALDSSSEVLRTANSNSGKEIRIVHLAAPGEEIPSICEGNAIGTLSGSSQSTAIVSGAAALLFKSGKEDPAVVKRRLLYTAEFLKNPHIYWGRLNVARAVEHVGEDKLCLRSDIIRADRQPETGKSCNKWYVGNVAWAVKDKDSFIPITKVVITFSDKKTREPVNVNDICRLYADTKHYIMADCSKKNEKKDPNHLERLDGVQISPYDDTHRNSRLYIRISGLEGVSGSQNGWVDFAEIGDLVLSAR